MKITNIYAEEIKDSRNEPTIRVFVETSEHAGDFAVPSGASTGVHEAWELRDDDGGVQKAISHVNKTIKEALIGADCRDQKNIDRLLLDLDGTPNKSKIGGNATIGVSIAVAKLASKTKNLSLVEHLRSLSQLSFEENNPFLYANLINGGSHAESSLAFQEYMVVPKVEDPSEALDILERIEGELEKIIDKEFSGTKKGDEGGYALETKDLTLPLELLERASNNVSCDDKVSFAIDAAASSFYKDGKYEVGEEKLTSQALMDIYFDIIKNFPIISIEDPLHEEDFEGFSKILAKSDGTLIVGDDLTVTNKNRLDKALKNKSVNALIIKPNQIGTLSETMDTIEFARENNVKCIVSHRSGETHDTFIADLAVAFGCFGIKAGSPKAPERAVKYNRLLEITN